MHFLLFLEFIGTTELLVVLLVALLVFGPRKLPELGRSTVPPFVLYVVSIFVAWLCGRPCASSS